MLKLQSSNICERVLVQFLMYLITCEFSLHLSLMSGPDSRDWVFLSLGLVRGTSRARHWEVSRHKLSGLSLQLQFLQKTGGSIPGESDTLKKCQPSACQKEVLWSMLLVFSVDSTKEIIWALIYSNLALESQLSQDAGFPVCFPGRCGTSKSAPLRSQFPTPAQSPGFYDESLQASGCVLIAHLQNWCFIKVQCIGALIYFSRVFPFFMPEDNYRTHEMIGV